jgi:hypothetical protein
MNLLYKKKVLLLYNQRIKESKINDMNNIQKLADTLGPRIAKWRLENWPPKGINPYDGLPLYIGDYDRVSAFAETLAPIMAEMSSHIVDKCRGRIPRWMLIPRVGFEVTRINLTMATAKESKSFDTTTALSNRCGLLKLEVIQHIESELIRNPNLEIKAHRSFNDIRAYVWNKKEEMPSRFRFLDSGLVLSYAEVNSLNIQDNRRQLRKKRKDALKNPLGTTDSGWEVYLVNKK